MNLLRKIFNINNLILVFAIVFFSVGVYQFAESFDRFDKMLEHKGIVESKYISYKFFSYAGSYRYTKRQDSAPVFNFKVFGDSRWYTTSIQPEGVNNLIEAGDSIDFYTKEITSKYGNTVHNGKGRFWNTHSPNEVFHIVSNKYPDPVVDFYTYSSNLRSSSWVFPLLALIMLAWYFYRRSGKKSALVHEYSSIG